MHTSTSISELEFNTLLDTVQREACDPWYSSKNAPAHWDNYYSQTILEHCITFRGYPWSWLQTEPLLPELLEELNNILVMVRTCPPSTTVEPVDSMPK